MANSVEILRMRIWTIGQVSKEMNISYLAARAHVLHAESASDEIKAKAAAKVSGLAITPIDISGDDIYTCGAIACGVKPSKFGDGSFLKNLFAFITDPANQAAAMKFLQFIMTLIALFPKAVMMVSLTAKGFIDFPAITQCIIKLEAIQQDLTDKQTIAAASQSDLAKAQQAVSSAAADVSASQDLFTSEINYIKGLLDQDSSAVNPTAPTSPPATPSVSPASGT